MFIVQLCYDPYAILYITIKSVNLKISIYGIASHRIVSVLEFNWKKKYEKNNNILLKSMIFIFISCIYNETNYIQFSHKIWISSTTLNEINGVLILCMWWRMAEDRKNVEIHSLFKDSVCSLILLGRILLCGINLSIRRIFRRIESVSQEFLWITCALDCIHSHSILMQQRSRPMSIVIKLISFRLKEIKIEITWARGLH